MKLSISVIGSGIGGLAVAIRLAVRGHDVDVFEQSPGPGGKLNELRWEGYRWDTGPSLFTLPELMEELYLLAGEEMKVSVRYHPLEVITKYFYEDGVCIDAYGDPQRFAAEVHEQTGESESRVLKYLRRAERMYNLTRDVFIFNSFSSLRTFFSGKFLTALVQAWRLDPLSTMHGTNSRTFKSPHLVQLFDRYATYNGSNPYEAPGTLNMISHLEHSLGAYFPEKGMYNLADELYELARRLGVKFHFNSRVEKIMMTHHVVKGVVVDGKPERSDLVISDVDIYYVYRDLLSNLRFPEKYFSQERSTSAMIFYWAMDKKFPRLDLHNLFFSNHYKEEFEHLFKSKTITDDPTVYLFISSRIHEQDAPANGENWFVMINVPENVGQDWDAEITRAKSNIISKINRMLDESIEPHIVHETVGDPRTIEEKTFSYRGSLYGNSSNSKFSAFRRHPNSRNDIHGLYFVGGSVHPGGGIPLCLASAKIVDQQIIKHYSQ